VSIRAVADAVGVTPPSIYLHFADKSDLLFAVCERHFAALDRVTEAALEGVEDPVERIRWRGRAYIRFGLDHPEPYRILFMSRADASPAAFTEKRLSQAAAFGGLVDDVAAAMAVGAMAPDDPFTAACGLWALVHGITSLLTAKADFPWPPLEEFVEKTLDAYSHGLLRR
jgi:AcrR family transcriptional regulator